MVKTTITKFLILTIILTAALSVNYLFAAWVGPTQAPPGGNTSTPIHVGSTNQVKEGGLSVDALSVFGNGWFQGSLDVDGQIKVGKDESISPDAGTIRWTGLDFEGYDGTQWVSLVSGEVVAPPADPNYVNCVNAGADWIESQGACYFPGNSCPSGWTKKNSYSSSSGNSCDGTFAPGCQNYANGTACSTGSHYRENIAIESCGYAIQKGASVRGQYYNCYPWEPWRVNAICAASQTEIGCTKN